MEEIVTSADATDLIRSSFPKKTPVSFLTYSRQSEYLILGKTRSVNRLAESISYFAKTSYSPSVVLGMILTLFPRLITSMAFA